MPEDDDNEAGTVRVLNFQGQTGFDADVLTTKYVYKPKPSSMAERVSYTISYPGSSLEVDPNVFADTFPDAMQDAAINHLLSITKK